MEVVLNSDEKVILKMETNNSLANAIRRSADEVPTLAIDEVEIFSNDSALYDEMLAHRIGLVPLKTDKKMGEKTSIDLKLVKKGPGWVYSGDLEGNAKVVFDNIPLTLLDKNQGIELVATAKLGKGIDHAKHNPGLIYYNSLYEVKSGNQEVQKIVQNSKGAISPEKKGSSWICDLRDADVDEISHKDKDAIKESGESLLIVESWGNFSAKELLINAIEALKDNLTDFEKSVKS